MKANERHIEGSSSLGNLKDTTISSISNRPHNFHSYGKLLRKFYRKKPKTCNSIAPGIRNFKAETILIHATEVIFATFTKNLPNGI